MAPRAILQGCSLALLLVSTNASSAADWPQYRGAHHNGVSTDRITRQWTGAVTNPVWRIVLTNGLGSLVVADGRVFTQVRRTTNGGPKELCVALHAGTGAELWAVPLDDAAYPDGGVGFDDGPRTTPAVEGGSVFVLTSYLKLHRLNATNGAVIWEKDLRTLYGSSVIDWQNAASPVLDNGLIYLNANSGTDTLMALRTSDGGLAWRSQNEGLTHSTPVLATIHGVRQLIFATQAGLVSLEPLTGNRLWKFSYPFNYRFSIGVSPVVYEDMVFVCGAHAYGMRSVAMQASLTDNTWTTTHLWSTNNPTSHWMTPVVHEGFLYGQFGIQSFDSVRAQLKCIEMRTGNVKWSTNDFGRGATILVRDHLLSLTEKGDLVLVKPDTNAYVQVARFNAIPYWHTATNKCWNSPAVCDGKVYIRSTSYTACFDFSVPDLVLNPPEPAGPNLLQLTARTASGAALDSNRLAGMELRASTDLMQPLPLWDSLTNRPVLTNGAVRIDNIDWGTGSNRFFIIREQE